MNRLCRALYSLPMFDAVFAIAGVTGLGGLLFAAGHGLPAIEPGVSPLAKGGALVAVVVASAAISSQSTRLDQRMADDFLFQVLSKSAFMALMTFVFVAVFWKLLFQHGLGSLSSDIMLGVAVAAWSLSYFFTRIWGTRP